MDANSVNLETRISMRPAVLPDDEDFLIKLYFTTREDVALIPLPQTQKDAFLQMQYAAQKQHYEAYFPAAAHELILFDRRPIGRLMVGREDDEILCIDISILPEYRNQGIGTMLMRRLTEEAAQTARNLSLHVIQNNRAVRLYQRLGLKITGETGVHFKMETRAAD